MELRKFIATTIREYLNESNGYSTDSKEMYNILKDSPFIKYVDRPSGRFLHSIDLRILDFDNIDEINKIIDNHNWYLERHRDKSVTITQKYVKDAKVSIPNKLYHITPTKNLDSILKNGLIPKSEDLRHKYPARIYVGDNINSLDGLSKELKRWKGNEEYSLIEIDTDGLVFDLFIDTTSAYKGNYYIQDIPKIPRENLKLVE